MTRFLFIAASAFVLAGCKTAPVKNQNPERAACIRDCGVGVTFCDKSVPECQDMYGRCVQKCGKD